MEKVIDEILGELKERKLENGDADVATIIEENITPHMQYFIDSDITSKLAEMNEATEKLREEAKALKATAAEQEAAGKKAARDLIATKANLQTSLQNQLASLQAQTAVVTNAQTVLAQELKDKLQASKDAASEHLAALREFHNDRQDKWRADLKSLEENKAEVYAESQRRTAVFEERKAQRAKFLAEDKKKREELYRKLQDLLTRETQRQQKYRQTVSTLVERERIQQAEWTTRQRMIQEYNDRTALYGKVKVLEAKAHKTIDAVRRVFNAGTTSLQERVDARTQLHKGQRHAIQTEYTRSYNQFYGITMLKIYRLRKRLDRLRANREYSLEEIEYFTTEADEEQIAILRDNVERIDEEEKCTMVQLRSEEELLSGEEVIAQPVYEETGETPPMDAIQEEMNRRDAQNLERIQKRLARLKEAASRYELKRTYREIAAAQPDPDQQSEATAPAADDAPTTLPASRQ